VNATDAVYKTGDYVGQLHRMNPLVHKADSEGSVPSGLGSSKKQKEGSW
jgi:hypothetical protein